MKEEDTIAAAEFKAKCLKLLAEVAATGRSITITKRGKPLVKVVPVNDVMPPLWDEYRGKVWIDPDIAEIDFSDEWEALKD